jgi:hypothetical protein
LKKGTETRHLRFEGLESLEKKGIPVDRENYVLAYTAPLPPGETLEGIYKKLNVDQPEYYGGHSLSVSDVVSIRKDGETTSHYVDRIGFSELSSFIGTEKQKEQADPAVETPKSEIAVYKSSVATALKNNEMETLWQSRDLNIECGQAIDKAVSDNTKFGEMAGTQWVDTEKALKSVIEEFGADRVAWVLATNVHEATFDGRFSKDNKDWANGFNIEAKCDIHLSPNRTIVDGLVSRFLKMEKEKPSLLKTLEATDKKIKQQPAPEPGREKLKMKLGEL